MNLLISSALVGITAAVGLEVIIVLVGKVRRDRRSRVTQERGVLLENLSRRLDVLYDAASDVAADMDDIERTVEFKEKRRTLLDLQVTLAAEAARRALLSKDRRLQDRGLRDLASLGTESDLELLQRFSSVQGRAAKLVEKASNRIRERESGETAEESDESVAVG